MQQHHHLPNILLILFGFVLVGILVGFFLHNHSFSPVSFPNVTGQEHINPFMAFSPNTCGLVVTSPLPDTIVHSPIVIKGIANGCGWKVVDQSAGTVQLLNDQGQVCSGTYILFVGPRTLFAPATFTATVYPSGFRTTKGTLFFRSNGTLANQQLFELPIVLN